MDIELAAAMIARAREGDERRYEGCVMWSALPWAPVFRDRNRVARLLRRPRRKR